MSDARIVVRIALALLWPLGLIAFAVTLTILLIASLIAFPIFGCAVIAAAIAFWMLN
jgi:hypothetical protein